MRTVCTLIHIVCMHAINTYAVTIYIAIAACVLCINFYNYITLRIHS